jgi:hypothetical protein
MNNVLFRRGDQTFIDENVPLNDGQIIFNETDEAIYVDTLINGSVVRKRYGGGNLSRSDIDMALSTTSENPVANKVVADANTALQNEKIQRYDTLTLMKADTELSDGMYALTGGYYSVNDGGGALYRISETEPTAHCETLTNGLYAELIVDGFVTPVMFGAKCDGVTDDTVAMQLALEAGSVKLPSGSRIKINNLYVPDFREIDFNGSFVYTNSYAIKCLATVKHGFVRNITIRNAHFITPNIATSAEHTYGAIYLDGAIKCNIINCELANVYDGTDFVYIRNSFNTTIERCYAGTGSDSTNVNTNGVSMFSGTPLISGTNNLTNISIRDMLIQNLKNGIKVEGNGLYDTSIIQNIGFSYCDNCITFSGDVRNVKIDTIRCEFCGKGIVNNDSSGFIEASNVYFTRMTDDAIYNTGTMIVSGNVIGYNPSGYQTTNLYHNSGTLDTINTAPTFVAKMTVNNTGTFIKPVIPNGDSTFTNNRYESVALVTGTSNASGGEFTINYPNGFNRNNSIVIGKQLYRTNNQWREDVVTVGLASSAIVVGTPTDDSTTFSRNVEIMLMKKYL